MTIAGVVQGSTGFGFGLVAIALLSLFMEVKDASVMLAIAGFLINVSVLWRLRRYFSLQRMIPILLATIVGVPLGVFFLLYADKQLIRLFLGIIMLVVVIQRLSGRHSTKRWHPYYLGIPCGLLAGAMAGALGIGGPPAVAYTASQDFNRFRYVANVQMVLAVGAVARIISLGVGNAFTCGIIVISVIGGLGAVVGASYGIYLLKRIPDAKLKRIITLLLAIITVKELATLLSFF
jgi:uncharacterized protein